MSERLAKSAGLIGAATLTSRVLGLVRDVAQAHYFGTSLENDAFVVATRIPTLLRDLFAEGAMSAAFVPTFTRYLKTEGKAAAWRLGSQVVNGLLLVTGVLVVLGIIFAEPLARLYAGAFAAEPRQARADDLAHADQHAVPAARRGRRGVHGHAERAPPVLRAGDVARDVQRRLHRVHRDLRAGVHASRASSP